MDRVGSDERKERVPPRRMSVVVMRLVLVAEKTRDLYEFAEDEDGRNRKWCSGQRSSVTWLSRGKLGENEGKYYYGNIRRGTSHHHLPATTATQQHSDTATQRHSELVTQLSVGICSR